MLTFIFSDFYIYIFKSLFFSHCILILGPVFVEFPIDTLYPYAMVNKEVGAKNKGKGLVQNIVNW